MNLYILAIVFVTLYAITFVITDFCAMNRKAREEQATWSVKSHINPSK